MQPNWYTEQYTFKHRAQQYEEAARQSRLAKLTRPSKPYDLVAAMSVLWQNLKPASEAPKQSQNARKPRWITSH